MSSRKPRGGSTAPDGGALPADPDTPEVLAIRKKLAHLLALGAIRAASRRDGARVKDDESS